MWYMYKSIMFEYAVFSLKECDICMYLDPKQKKQHQSKLKQREQDAMHSGWS
jgi:hypothetical protein